jgi:hypothetical protein
MRPTETYEKNLNEIINKNQDWFFPIISAVCFWWIAMGFDFISNEVYQISYNYEKFILITSVFFYTISIISILVNLFLTIHFATLMLERKTLWKKKKIVDNAIKWTFQISLILTISAILLMLIYFSIKYV